MSAVTAAGMSSFAAILAITVPTHLELVAPEALFVIGSFGATSCLLFASPDLPVSQPRNIVGGHVLSGTVGISLSKFAELLPPELGGDMNLGYMIAAPAAVGLAVSGMLATRTMHPPAAGTALVAVGAGAAKLGWVFVVPMFTGSTILVMIGYLINRQIRGLAYPKYWY